MSFVHALTKSHFEKVIYICPFQVIVIIACLDDQSQDFQENLDI
jgi:hypothetical protein